MLNEAWSRESNSLQASALNVGILIQSGYLFDPVDGATPLPFHEKEKLILTPQETMDLGVGEFLGSVSASDAPFFRMHLSPIGDYHPKLKYEHFSPLPMTTARVDAQANFQAIRYQVREIMKEGKQAVQ